MRTKYKKYKEETHKLSILVDQLQKKLKKYHDENKILKEKVHFFENESYQDFGNVKNMNNTQLEKLDSQMNNALKESLNQGNQLKGMSYNDFNEDSKKRLSGSSSFQDLGVQNRLGSNFSEKENTKPGLISREGEKSPAKIYLTKKSPLDKFDELIRQGVANKTQDRSMSKDGLQKVQSKVSFS